ncbi:type II toxin-antitoxin system RelE/ParE family toxin [Leptospira santarosai]|uniref:Toxin-antitoxin system, toxin component, RelE family n=1 Tax=Leptospira santarosai str. MOR084 TaxID=1049984 RepID=A0A0E2BKP8_9LEPT|nr:hypothetical protein [Leptospira santarosai]EKO31845.1 toxin-antitoxin system, toxin component, RelE family [Leptospira santarosai str. MOR084]MDI7184741.1 type II toxin-antitoxin system RelE/ParE family toxin [Leptospira santarosai]MDI7200040.1 type II toxin-antitoxin system RelE/ParE family toxin [Leptospira santarosai]
MKSSELHTEAEEDVIQTVEFYENCRSGLGELFFTCYVRARSLIEQFPDGAPRYSYNPNIRRISIEDFPYSIYYSSLEDKIFILAVIHDSRRPGFWLERLKPL